MAKRFFRRINRGISHRFQYLFNNSGITGLRFFGERCGPSGKLFWILSFIISGIGMYYILRLTFESFRDTISITVDTHSLAWASVFPSVAICHLQKKAPSRSYSDVVKSIINRSFPSNHENIAAYHALVGLTNLNLPMIKPTTKSTYGYCKKTKNVNETCNANWIILANEILPQHCSEIMNWVKFDKKFYSNCSDIFKLHKHTYAGSCFIANSILDYDLDYRKVPLTHDWATLDASLKISLRDHPLYQFKLYVQTAQDLPSSISIQSKPIYKNLRYLLKTKDIVNEENVIFTSIDERDCKFAKELTTNKYFHYSVATCLTEIAILVSLKMCNCTLPSAPEKFANIYCNITGLDCIVENHEQIERELEDRKSECISSCDTQYINEVGDSINDKDYFEIAVINKPNFRLVRQVTKTNLDLVVSIGGIVGLFFGASIINTAELIYIYFIKKFTYKF